MMENLNVCLKILANDGVVWVETRLRDLQRVDETSALANVVLVDGLLRLNVYANQGMLGSKFDGDSVLVDALHGHELEVAVSIRAKHQVLVDCYRSLGNHAIENDSAYSLYIKL